MTRLNPSHSVFNGAPCRPRALGFLPAFLFRTNGARLRYVGLAWLLCLIPSLALTAAVNLLMPDFRTPELPVGNIPALTGLVIAAPFLETLLMSGPLLLFDRLFGFTPAVIASAALWGILHALAAPAWGLVAWWPFLIFSTVFLVWRREGYWWAVLIVTLIHALQNFLPGVAFWLMARAG